MSVRAVVIGLVGAVIVGATGYFNDIVMHQTFLYNNYLPLFIFGLVILFVVLVNPLLFYVSKRLALSAGEIALAVAIALPACAVSSRNLIHHFTGNIMAPRYMNLTNAGWQEHDLIDRVPQVMLAGVRPEYASEDVVKPVELCAHLGRDIADPSPAEVKVGSCLLIEGRKALAQAASDAEADPEGGGKEACRRAARSALNGLIARRDLFDAADLEGLALPAEAERFLKERDSLLDVQVRRMNRRILDTVFADEVASLESKEERVVKGWRLGLGEGSEHISASDVPWYAWGRTMLFWVPLFLASAAALLGLALVAHRRWSEQEHYPYPIVMFAKAILPEEGRPASSLFRSRMFWIAAVAVAVLHVNNYAFMYWNQYMFQIPQRFDFRSLSQFVPGLKEGGDWSIMNPRIFFTAVGLAYFIANDVSFSMGIAPSGVFTLLK
ncbi:MAG: DUF6785 family protein [Planctomycetota bacterium]